MNHTVNGEGGRKNKVSMRQYPDVSSLDWCNFAIEGRNERENNADDCLEVNCKAGAYPSDVGVGFEASEPTIELWAIAATDRKVEVFVGMAMRNEW